MLQTPPVFSFFSLSTLKSREMHIFFLLETFKSIKPKFFSGNQIQLLAGPLTGVFLPSESWYMDLLESLCWEEGEKTLCDLQKV